MIRLILLMLLIAAGAIIGPIVAGNMGYVLIRFIGYKVEMTVVSLLLSLAVLVLVIAALEWLLRRLFRSIRRLRHWRSSRTTKKAQQATEQGLLAMAANDYSRAEKLIRRGASLTRQPALNYLFAAEAAQAQGDTEQRDRYLEQAESEGSGDEFAISMTRARLYHQLGEQQQAIVTLKQITGKQAKHPARLRLLKEALQADENWQQLLELLPQLRKQKIFPELALERIQQQALKGRLQQLANRQGAEAVTHYWQQLDRALRKQPAILAIYANTMLTLDAGQQVQAEVLTALKQQLHPELLNVMRYMKVAEPEALLNKIRSWRSAEHSDPLLYSALANVAYQAKHYEEALGYLRQALQIRQDADDYQRLGELYVQQGDTGKALEAYRKSLKSLPEPSLVHQ